MNPQDSHKTTENHPVEDNAKVPDLPWHKRHRRWIWIVGTPLVMIVLFLALVPTAAELLAERWLRQQGLENGQVENIDLNLFTGKLLIAGVDAGNQPDERLSLQRLSLTFRLLPLLQRRVELGALAINGLAADIQLHPDGRWQVGGLRLPEPAETTASPAPPEEETEPWTFALDLAELGDLNARYRDAQLDSNIEVRELRITDLDSGASDKQASLMVDLSVDGGGIRLQTDLTPFASEPQVSGTLKLANLDISHYAPLANNAGITEPRGIISLDLEIEAAMLDQGRVALKIGGDASASGVAIAMDALRLQQEQANWSGEIVFSGATDAPPTLQLEGALQTQASALSLPPQQLELRQQELNWEGQLSFRAGTEQQPAAVTTSGDARVAGLSIADIGKQLMLASVEEIRARGLTLTDPLAVQLGSLTLTGIHAVEPRESGAKLPLQRLSSLKNLEATEVAYAAQEGVSIATLAISDLGLDLLRNTEGKFLLVEQLVTAPADAVADAPPESTGESPVPEEVTEQSDTTPEPLRIRLGTLEIGGESWVHFRDQSVSPEFDAIFRPVTIKVNDIDSAKPDEPSAVEFNARLGDYTTLTATGTVQPFAEALSLELQVKVDGLDLPVASSYTPAYAIKRGRLQLDSQVSAKAGELDVVNRLEIHKLQLEAKTENQKRAVAGALGMPLDIALDMLRDSKDRIRLKIPVTGNASDPKFDLRDIFNTAAAKALQNAAMSYVKNALQPLGTIMLVGQLAGKAAAPRFQPQSFDPGATDLDASGREYMNKIADLLESRPRLQLTFCGVATDEDRQLLEQQAQEAARQAALENPEGNGAAEKPGQDVKQTTDAPPTASENEPATAPLISEDDLLTLAKQRGASVKDYLVQQRNIEAQRLYACNPWYDDSGVPRVDIHL